MSGPLSRRTRVSAGRAVFSIGCSVDFPPGSRGPRSADGHTPIVGPLGFERRGGGASAGSVLRRASSRHVAGSRRAHVLNGLSRGQDPDREGLRYLTEWDRKLAPSALLVPDHGQGGSPQDALDQVLLFDEGMHQFRHDIAPSMRKMVDRDTARVNSQADGFQTTYGICGTGEARA